MSALVRLDAQNAAPTANAILPLAISDQQAAARKAGAIRILQMLRDDVQSLKKEGKESTNQHLAGIIEGAKNKGLTLDEIHFHLGLNEQPAKVAAAIGLASAPALRHLAMPQDVKDMPSLPVTVEA